MLSAPDEAKKIADSTPATKVKSATVTSEEVPQTTTTTLQNYIRYRVESGDTFYSIAKEHSTSVAKLQELNKVASDELKVGMFLKIPAQGKAPAQDNNQVAPTQEASSQATSIKPAAQEIFRGPADARQVALTFDAGADSDATPMILKALKDANVQATFFLTGKWVEANPGLTKKIAQDGHVIGNHTLSHPDLTKLTDDRVIEQLSATDDLIKQAVGYSSKPLFRFPYGARDARVLRTIAQQGYRSIYWTTDSLDWKPEMTPEKVKGRVLGGLGNGAIILMHCGSGKTADCLPQLLAEIKNRGYDMVTIPEMFE
jgi:peptidoglycan/xylan/chitin deacetylase (PgdA/CDA1 family)/gas vesicle protein